MSEKNQRKPLTSTRYYYTKKYVRKLAATYGVEALKREFS